MNVMSIINSAKESMDAPIQKSYVVRGATTSCTLGSISSRLTLTKSHGVYIKDKAQLNIMDNHVKNILPFGKCKVGKVCIPTVARPWQNGKETVLIEGQPALLDSSICFCLRGGVIKIDNDGQE